MKHLMSCLQSSISLKVLMTAEMNTERLKSDDIAKAAKILRKREAMITADELKFIQQRIAKRELARENPSSSSSGTKPGQGNRVENDAAVVKKVPRAPSEPPPNIPPAPRRPTPPIEPPDPPAKRLKGAPKGASERAPSGSKGAQKGAAFRAESASSSGKGKGKGKCEGKGKSKGERARTPSARPYSRTPPRDDNFDHLPIPPACLVERRDGARIQRNTTVDFREVDRLRCESEAPLRRGAPMHDPPNDAYVECHENAWVGQHPNPHAEYRYHGGSEGYRAEVRGRNEGWQPTLAQSNLAGRQRTRTPRAPNTERGWDAQNMRSQHRRNVEYQRDRAAGARYAGYNLDAMGRTSRKRRRFRLKPIPFSFFWYTRFFNKRVAVVVIVG